MFNSRPLVSAIQADISDIDRRLNELQDFLRKAKQGVPLGPVASTSSNGYI